MGIEWSPSPSKNIELKAKEIAAKLAELQHKVRCRQSDQQLKASDAAVRVADLAHKDAVATKSHTSAS
jgi:hypothetical protein